MPRVTTSETSSVQGRSAVGGHRSGGPHDQPAHRVADQRDPVTSARATRRRAAAAARPAPRRSRAAAARCWPGATPASSPAAASASAYVVPMRSRPRSQEVSFSHSPCRKTTTRPVASGKAAARASAVGATSAALGAHRHGDGQLGPLAQQPVPDQAVDRRAEEPAPRARPRARGPTPGRPRRPCRAPRTRARRPAASPPYTAAAMPRCSSSGPRSAAGRAPGDGVHPSAQA